MRSVCLLVSLMFINSATAQAQSSAIEALKYCAKLKKMLPACKKLEVECATQKASCERSRLLWEKEKKAYDEHVRSLEGRVEHLTKRLQEEITKKPVVVVRRETPAWVLPVMIVGGVVLLGAGIGVGVGVAYASGVR